MREKKSAEPEMGYCPFEHQLGRTRSLGTHGARAWAGRWALGHWAQAGARGARGRGAQGAGCTWACWLGCGLWIWCTQPVFDPVSTQYCS